MKALVTGANGFIGRYVVKQLLEISSCDIIATSLEAQGVCISKDPRIKYISKDLAKTGDDAYSLFEKPDMLIHLAWQGLPNYFKLHHIEDNLSWNYRFLKNMLAGGLPDLTVIGTCFEYGLQNGCLSEEFETKPETLYALGKDTLRKFIEALKREYTFDYKWVRVFYPYGEGQAEQSILGQLKRAIDRGDSVFNMSKGDQLRDYLPVEKAAEYIVKIALQKKITGVVNCCSGKPISIREFVENYLRAVGKKIDLNLGFYPYPAYEPLAFWGDTTKLNSIIPGFDCEDTRK